MEDLDFLRDGFSGYEDYLRRHNNRDNIAFDTFRNKVVFLPASKQIMLEIDGTKEATAINYMAGEHCYDPPELTSEMRQENETILDRFLSKYSIQWDGQDWDEDESAAGTQPRINVLSGGHVELKYGEGILDFIYADFGSAFGRAKKRHDFPVFGASREIIDPPENEEDEENLTKKRLREIKATFEEYRETFPIIKEIACASLYSAVFPPRFIGEADIMKMSRYGSYLLTLQEEYLRLLMFVYDDDCFPEVLGKLHPNERYFLYRSINRLPHVFPRREKLVIGGDMSDREMPFGMSDEELAARLHAEEKPTPADKDFAEFFHIPVDILVTWLKYPVFLSTVYDVRSIAEMLELEFTKMLEADVRFCRCKRCGRYFLMKGNYNANYCDRVDPDIGRTCQQIAAAENYRAKIAINKEFPLYNKYYKRYSARVKARQLKIEVFRRWQYEAIVKRNECSAGKITLEQYEAWLEGYFPNRNKNKK